MRFTVVVDNTGNCTVTVTHGGDSPELETQLLLQMHPLETMEEQSTFNVATISESMQIFIEEGKGVGQFGIIDEYPKHKIN